MRMLDDPEIARRYRRAPAAKHIHHAFLGGLIEHVLSLCALAKTGRAALPVVDRDLLLTGVVLHDIGKIYELNYERGFSYSTEGQLIGHIAIALRMVADKLRALPDFPPPLRTLVEHMILSHHGHLDFGSPKVPQFPEALLLHYLDDLDSKMECMRALIQNDRQLDGCFTGYSASLERTVLKMDRYWAEVPPAARSPGTGKRGQRQSLFPRNRAPNLLRRVPPARRSRESRLARRPNCSGAAARRPRLSRQPPSQHPLFAPKPESPFADKLRPALEPALERGT